MAFLRAVKVIVDNLVIESDVAGVRRGLTMDFDVKQSLSSKENTCEVKIINLSETTRGLLSGATVAPAFTVSPLGLAINPYQKSGAFEVHAGYQDEGSAPGLVFKGEYKRIWHERKGVDWVTHVSATDGHQAKQAVVNLSFDKDAKAGEIISKIVESFAGDLKGAKALAEKHEYIKAFEFLRDRIVSGSGKDELDKLSKTLGFDWNITNGEVVLLNPDEVLGGLVVKLTPDTGLIGSPEPHYIDKFKDNAFVKAHSLLNSSLVPGRGVILHSREYSAAFKVIYSRHHGSTAEGDFFSEVIMLILPVGKIKSIDQSISNTLNKETPVSSIQNMHISSAGLTLLKQFEGSVKVGGLHVVYLDKNGLPATNPAARGNATIGYGHLLTSDEFLNTTYASGLTDAQAEELLKTDCIVAEEIVKRKITVSLTQNQFDALTIFSLNVGPSYRNLAKVINSGTATRAEIEAAFLEWNRANGVPGFLTSRRQKEINLYFS